MRSRRSERPAWIFAWALALVFHAGAILGLRSLPVMEPDSASPRKPEPVQLVFARPGTETRTSDAPHFFSELPPNRTDEAPKKADFLSNVTSRARDLVPGGDDALPRMEGVVDAPLVALEPGESPSQPSAPATSQPAQPSSRSTASAQDQLQSPTLKTGSGAASVDARDVASAPPAGGPAFPGPSGVQGNSDIHQPEMDNPSGNAGLTGDVSLNTTAWDYAPWLQRFGRELMRRWRAPEAYYLGILKEGGWVILEAEISPSGELLRLDLLEQQGHLSLTTAAQSAVRSMPIEKLPADFPEPTLILRLRMIYPKYSQLRRATTPAPSRPGRRR